MIKWEAIFYLFGVVLLVLAAFGVTTKKASLALLGAASLAIGFTLPTIVQLWS